VPNGCAWCSALKESLQVKTYLVVTGGVFGLVGIAHLLRLSVEGHPWSDPWFLGINMGLFIVAGGFAAWASLLFKRLREPS
jgi:drug/metabolite transporter (DMT)-like permease